MEGQAGFLVEAFHKIGIMIQKAQPLGVPHFTLALSLKIPKKNVSETLENCFKLLDQ